MRCNNDIHFICKFRKKAHNSFLVHETAKRVLWISLLVLVVIVGAGIYTLVRAQQTKAAAAAQQPASRPRSYDRKHHPARQRTGTLIAANEVNLEFKTSGILTKLNVKLGDQVKAGDLLAQTDDANQQVQLAQAQEALTN